PQEKRGHPSPPWTSATTAASTDKIVNACKAMEQQCPPGFAMVALQNDLLLLGKITGYYLFFLRR
uniref:Uncharacterized protein n=1 Tax=Aegilops tauschii subsp. strangulata TaxID=200361 RepID=A0A453DPX6_AEGTS